MSAATLGTPAAAATDGASGGSAPAGAPAPRPASLWRGRILLIIGVVLLGVSLRHAVTGMSPLLPVIREELGFGVAGASFLGMLPTLSFGIAGFIAPVLIRKLGGEATAVAAMLLAAVGTAGRAFTDSVPAFFALSIVALVGMGFGNVVGAPLVKKYFPDRPAPMLTVFALLMQAGATLPAMAAVPMADAAGWRVSIGSWAILAVVAALPWLIQLLKVLKDKAPASAGQSAVAAATGPRLGLAQLVKSPVAVGTALFYAMASLNTYGMLAWMPTMFADSGMDLGAAASAFSVFTFMTLPMAFITPILASKLKNPFPLAALVTVVSPIGYVGLIIAPEAAPVWALITGIGGGAFPLAITMFNLRTRTASGSAAISGFAMGVGYLFGTLGPLLGGALFSATGGWTVPLVAYSLTGILMLLGAAMMTKRGRYLEDKFETAIRA
jgi:MFS transporter, CP family, cyanate transporter